MTLAFTVYGKAESMGSKRAFTPKGWTRPVITDSNRNLKAWQSLVADAASSAIQARGVWQVLDGPVRLTVAFYLPRPKSLPKRDVAHVKAPDCSKLLRSTEDALSGIVYRDDSQIVEIVAGKFYAPPTAPPHADIRIEPTAGARPVVVPPAPLPLFGQDAQEAAPDASGASLGDERRPGKGQGTGPGRSSLERAYNAAEMAEPIPAHVKLTKGGLEPEA